MGARRATQTTAGRPRTIGAAVALAALLTFSGCVLIPRLDREGLRALEAGHTVVGAWLGKWPDDGDIRAFEKATGVRLDLVDVYLDWYTPPENVSFTLRNIANRGALPVLTWEAQGITTTAILDGGDTLPLRNGRTVSIDAYLNDFGASICKIAKQTGQPILVRILHEMNGHWFAWGISHVLPDGTRPNTNESYRAAWLKIHDAFHSRCGDAVRFVYAVNHFSVGAESSFLGPYPGDEYVDYVGIDGYNWGANAPWGWQGFETLFRPAYCALATELDKPILISEVASTERGGKKSEWIAELFVKLREYDEFQGFVWFNDRKYERETRIEIDWPVDSSPAALAAFSAGARTLAAQRLPNAAPDIPENPVVC